ncbi:MAG: peptide deformylase [Muribaculaceae bacterium]|nr:peptide deformylase [Muribaculaceae bacterium]MDE5972333.1 peptide deformylase [Muribaculaceae bacterium]MDE6462258.1 peptide deformylase [Muribaculaceae bacterium]MDE6509909.1 peptide deformylase [Muribaculaceae bacterium]
MKLPIYLYGHPVLRKVSEPIDLSAYDGLSQLVDDMFETMYASDGCGLAAPQIGRNDRIVVIDADVLKDSHPECAGRRLVLINPEIEVLDGDPVKRSEGCLSLPGLSEDVERVEHIRLDWTGIDGVSHSEEMSGFLSRIVQHECDHLEGKVYMDHVSGTRRMLLRSKLRGIVEGKVSCGYRVVSAPKKRK